MAGETLLLLVVMHKYIYYFFQTKLWPLNGYAFFAKITCFGK